MSQSPSDDTSPESSRRYLENWNAMGEMISQGVSFSGRERNRCFLNTHATRFADVSAASGLDLIDDGRGIALVDWDHDGDLDFWLTNRTGPRVRLMRNDAVTRHHWLAVRLQGTICNRDAIGARVEVHLGGQTPHSMKISKTLRAGEGFLSQSSKWLHFGLGGHQHIDQVVVRWPGSEMPETFTDMKVDGRYRIVQGSGRTTREPQRNEIFLAASHAQPARSTEQVRTLLIQRLPIKDLAYDDFDGKTHKLIPSDASPRLINLWASWCQPCISELREFSRRADQLQDLRIVALSVDGLQAPEHEGQGGDVAAARELVQALRLPFQTGLASDEVIQELTKLDHSVYYRQMPLPIPCSFLFDGRGQLAAIYKGPIDVEQLLADTQLLAARRRQIELAAAPFPGRRVVKDYDPSPLGLATAYLEGGYLEEAREQALRHIESVSSVTDLDQLAATLLESLRPGVMHERTSATDAGASSALATTKPAANPEATEGKRILRGLQVQRQQALVRGYRLLARIEQLRSAFDEQIEALRELVRLQPDDVTAQADLAVSLGRHRSMEEANERLDRALQAETDSHALVVLGQARIKLRQVDAAIALFRRAVEQSPDEMEARMNLAIVHQMRGETPAAVAQYQLILEKHPESHEALNNLAWILATDQDASNRNGTLAVSFARRLCAATAHQQPAYLDTLAAALAEAGKFAEAIQVTDAALELARGTAQYDLAKTLAQHRQAYANQQAIRP